MSEPQRTGTAATQGDLTREAHIERLLVAGLDHYFGGQYEQAINVWTRVIFLDRGHGRARAYIERARSALAERQRESEELLHGGVEAYNAGQLEHARDLLTRAVEKGGPSDTALMFLDRLSRVEPLLPAEGAETWPADDRAADAHSGAQRTENWTATVLASAILVGLVVLAAMWTVNWFTGMSDGSAEPPLATAVEPLPIVQPAEVAIERAGSLLAAGRARDALALLDASEIGPSSVARAEALRGEIQRRLLVEGSGRGEGGRP